MADTADGREQAYASGSEDDWDSDGGEGQEETGDVQVRALLRTLLLDCACAATSGL
jgi:hypothetical protein